MSHFSKNRYYTTTVLPVLECHGLPGTFIWKAGKVSHLLSVTARRDPSLMPRVLAVFVLTLLREPLSCSSSDCFSCVSLVFVAASPCLKLQNAPPKMCDLWLWPLCVSEGEGGEMMPE